ncbi:MAG: hypothetical protein WD824_18390 [Cyclobacteriaceae bacterium]
MANKSLLTTSIIILLSLSGRVEAQKFYLGNYLEPTSNEFDLIGVSSKTGVSSYKYKKEIYDSFFDRKIGDIIVGIRDGIIVTTIYNLIPRTTDKGVPSDILKLLESKFPYPFSEVNGVYGLNIDNESISIARTTNAMTLGKDRIMFLTTIKQSILEQTKK